MIRLPYRLAVAAIGVAGCIALTACSNSAGGSASSSAPASPLGSSVEPSPSGSMSASAPASGSEITAVVALSEMGRAALSYQFSSEALSDADHAEACKEATAPGEQQGFADSILEGLRSGLLNSGTDAGEIEGWPTQDDANQAAAETIEWMCGSGNPTPQSDEEQANAFRTLLVWMTQLRSSGESVGCTAFGLGTAQTVTEIASRLGLDEATAGDIGAAPPHRFAPFCKTAWQRSHDRSSPARCASSSRPTSSMDWHWPCWLTAPTPPRSCSMRRLRRISVRSPAKGCGADCGCAICSQNS